jgi:hypothetical protein
MKPAYRRVLLFHGGWMIDGVVVADSHRARLLGLNLPGVRAILIRSNSVHTFTMRRPIRLTPIGEGGDVGVSVIAPPRRVLLFPAPTWILESFVEIDAPPAGVVLRVLPSGSDGRNTHTLRHPDRESI